MLAPINQRNDLRLALEVCEQIIDRNPDHTFAQVYKWEKKKFQRAMKLAQIDFANQSTDWIACLFLPHEYVDGSSYGVGAIRAKNFPSRHNHIDRREQALLDLHKLEILNDNLKTLAKQYHSRTE
jgi:hypothetical protein